VWVKSLYIIGNDHVKGTVMTGFKNIAKEHGPNELIIKTIINALIHSNLEKTLSLRPICTSQYTYMYESLRPVALRNISSERTFQTQGSKAI
jgi:hypothetical protein